MLGVLRFPWTPLQPRLDELHQRSKLLRDGAQRKREPTGTLRSRHQDRDCASVRCGTTFWRLWRSKKIAAFQQSLDFSSFFGRSLVRIQGPRFWNRSLQTRLNGLDFQHNSAVVPNVASEYLHIFPSFGDGFLLQAAGSEFRSRGLNGGLGGADESRIGT
jgi:hypothetical protein